MPEEGPGSGYWDRAGAVSFWGIGEVRPKRKSRGRNVASVTSVEMPIAVKNEWASGWEEYGICIVFALGKESMGTERGAC